jgi:hypothetical protein
MAKISLSKQKNSYLSDYTLLTLISAIIQEGLKEGDPYGIIHKGVWVWNRTDKHFVGSPGFYHIMDISPHVIPDLDFWLERLAPEDLIKFSNIMDDVLHGSKPRNFVFQIANTNFEKRNIKGFIENFSHPRYGKSYIIGVFCDISESMFTHYRN